MSRPPRGPMSKAKKGTLPRVIKMFFKFYPVLAPLAVACILFAAITASLPPIFLQQVIAAIEEWASSGDWANASKVIIPKVATLVCFYLISICAIITQTQLMAYMTQGFLNKMRKALFDGMQNLPISYFDRKKHGDIMSVYTNDIDTLRQ
ncbi:MAG: ABC transporter ATP-binding protein, partial [Clostridia bacterium]|nr:ABC transporter ATP-binding protein [Clostridia bacterium]